MTKPNAKGLSTEGEPALYTILAGPEKGAIYYRNARGEWSLLWPLPLDAPEGRRQ